MTFAVYWYLVRSDLYRIHGRCDGRTLLMELIRGESYKVIFWLRTTRFAHEHRVLRWVLFPVARAMLMHYRYKFGIAIPYQTEIGPGLYIGHFSGVVVHPQARIGRNCNLSQGVTLGLANRGPRRGVPTIGDGVYVGPGAKLVGAVHVGNDVAIGANAVVTKDMPDGAVAVGVPAKVLSHEGAAGYVVRTDYENVLGPFPGNVGPAAGSAPASGDGAPL